ncbi:hypothetical protein HAX54_037674 [Datura stramonium]|uniref:Uncharacterized protein n=1 Tax=Datura stramonium TaxID=4076 RepID=A0ABS8VIL6_DATST|nr:hypothetical protein [Datura stramonium]
MKGDQEDPEDPLPWIQDTLGAREEIPEFSFLSEFDDEVAGDLSGGRNEASREWVCLAFVHCSDHFLAAANPLWRSIYRCSESTVVKPISLQRELSK